MTRESLTTDVQQICTWLGLPPSSWPPDHYTLLGLPPGERDVERIEQRVHERLTRLRSYQLSHPALATEAMTRLAKAFDCLTNPERKNAYDETNFPHLLPRQSPAADASRLVPSSRVPTTIATDTAETPAISPATPAPIHWQSPAAPPPIRAATEGGESSSPTIDSVILNGGVEPPPVRVPPAEPSAGQVLVGVPLEEPLPPNQATTDAILPAAPAKPRFVYLSSADLQPVRTRRDLYERILWARRLDRAWQRAGKYLNKPRRRLVKHAEETELTRLLLALDDLVQEMPGLLGQPGQVGYRILALNSQEPVAKGFKGLDEDHRDLLALDWNSGRRLLDEYRQLLMEQVKNERLLTPGQRGLRALNAMLAANWGWVLFALIMMGVLILVFIAVL